MVTKKNGFNGEGGGGFKARESDGDKGAGDEELEVCSSIGTPLAMVNLKRKYEIITSTIAQRVV